MTLFVPPGYKTCAYRFRVTGDLDEMVVTLGIGIDSLLDGQEAAEAAFLAITDTGRPCAPNEMLSGWSCVGTTVSEMTESGSLIYEHNGSSAGTVAAGGLPQNCCLLVHKRTGVGGRQHRGRMFFPCFNIGESSITNTGTFVEAHAEIQTMFSGWRSAMVALDLEPVLFHTNVSITPTPITAFIVDPTIATQRRRLR